MKEETHGFSILGLMVLVFFVALLIRSCAS